MTLDENNLARQLRAGEAGSFETLYREYGPRIFRFCRRLSCNDTVAEDLTQDVFLAAYRGAERFEGRSSLATWLYRIALYRWRKMQNTRSPEIVTLDETTAALSSDPVQTGLERIVLEEALAALPAPDRKSVV